MAERLREFISDRIEFRRDLFTDRYTLYFAYIGWAAARGIKVPCSVDEFKVLVFSALKTVQRDVTPYSKWEAGHEVRGFAGIGLKARGKVSA